MKPFIGFVTRGIISALFLTSGFLKLRDPDATLIAIFQYKILSWEASNVLSVLLPYLEITVALTLWAPRLRLGASLLCTGLTTVFLVALGSAVARNLDVSCGCFGTTDLYTTASRRFLEDVLLLLLCTSNLRYALQQARVRLQSVEQAVS